MIFPALARTAACFAKAGNLIDRTGKEEYRRLDSLSGWIFTSLCQSCTLAIPVSNVFDGQQ